ncbi:MAG: hypothetical protein J6R85_04450, partial [Lentisphaeria bacterium]|nr:hypothetical protein [Lentisphaeria bacterium]
PLHGGQSISGKGKPLAFHPDRNFVYCASDAAVSYGKKCKEAVRQFLYLKPDCFVIYDRMTPADPASRGEWLLHTAEKPVASAPGIHTAVNGGKLLVQTLLPEKTEFRLVGGKDKEFFASGQNWLPEKSGDWESVYTTAGRWRLEIPHPAPAKEIRYLHLLEASGDPDAQPLAAEKIQTEKTDGVRFTDRAGIRWEITFARQGKIAATVQRTAPDGTVARETL